MSPLQVRGALVLDEGEMRWPAPRSAAPAAPPPAPKKAEEAKGPKDLYPDTLRNALTTTGAAAATLAIGAVSPSSAFSGMLTKFGLASICGYQTVWGVSPALHSPLMSVTNAISGLTAVGGMVLAGGGVLPGNAAQVGVPCACQGLVGLCEAVAGAWSAGRQGCWGASCRSLVELCANVRGAAVWQVHNH